MWIVSLGFWWCLGYGLGMSVVFLGWLGGFVVVLVLVGCDWGLGDLGGGVVERGGGEEFLGVWLLCFLFWVLWVFLLGVMGIFWFGVVFLIGVCFV